MLKYRNIETAKKAVERIAARVERLKLQVAQEIDKLKDAEDSVKILEEQEFIAEVKKRGISLEELKEMLQNDSPAKDTDGAKQQKGDGLLV